MSVVSRAVNVARAVLSAGSGHNDVHELGRILADRGYPNSVSDGTNPFGIVDESILRAVQACRTAEGIDAEDSIPGVALHEARCWIGPKLWDALVSPAGKVKAPPKAA